MITVTGLLVIGLVLLAVGMARNSGKMVETAEAEQQARTARAPAGGLRGEHRIVVPPGTKLQSIAAEGGLLYLHVVDAGGGPRVIVLDAATGARRARILLEPAP